MTDFSRLCLKKVDESLEEGCICSLRMLKLVLKEVEDDLEHNLKEMR